ncbi:hypothetical protein H9P43_000829 [Blastocladiella emersonii ATCC 22665]|nr:hypothetical protein H9P43_000829 [Blastocladiella emersonii ATCC 22665]
MATFLGAPLAASFAIMPSRPLGDLFLDLLMQLMSLPLLWHTFAAMERYDDLLFLGAVTINRAVALFDTLMILFIDNSASAALIYFSLTRSLIRHLAYAVAMGYISQRRLVRVNKLVVRDRAAFLSYFVMGVTLLSVIVGAGIVVSFFISGISIKTVGDNFLAAHPRATNAELARATNAAVSTIPAKLWQLMQAVSLPMVHGLHMACDVFFYVIISGLWTTTFINVRKLTTSSWLSVSWPYVVSIVLHLSFLLITALSRTAMRRSPLGFVLELGQFCTAFDWYTFFVKTSPLLVDVTVQQVEVPSGSGSRTRRRTVYMKTYRQPNLSSPQHPVPPPYQQQQQQQDQYMQQQYMAAQQQQQQSAYTHSEMSSYQQQYGMDPSAIPALPPPLPAALPPPPAAASTNTAFAGSHNGGPSDSSSSTQWRPRPPSGSTFTAYAHSAVPATASTVTPSPQLQDFRAPPRRQHHAQQPYSPHALVSPTSAAGSTGYPFSLEQLQERRWQRAREDLDFSAAVEEQQRQQRYVVEQYQQRRRQQQQMQRQQLDATAPPPRSQYAQRVR